MKNLLMKQFPKEWFDPFLLELIEDNLELMLTVSKKDPRIDYITTSGTSGVPLKFYIGAERTAIEYAYLVSSWKRAGYKLGDTMAVFRGKIVSKTPNGFRHEYDPVLRHHYYSTFHMDEKSIGKYIEHIRKIGPCFLHVYPSSVANLARYIKRNGIEPPENIKGIIAESENVPTPLFCQYFAACNITLDAWLSLI